MYCQTSSSVQFDSGKMRTCSPRRTLPLYRLHSSGRWFLGSHWPMSSRNENTRSLARARSSSRRGPPRAAADPLAGGAAGGGVVCRRGGGAPRAPPPPPPPPPGRAPPAAVARRPEARLLDRAPGVDRRLHGGDDQPLAELGYAPVAELDHLGEVVPGVHVQDREREACGPERLLGQPQQHDRVLAAGEQQYGPLELGGDLAHDEDRLGLEQPQVREL